MTIEIIEERLDALLSMDQAKVLLLTGGWGAGKTYQWKQAIQRAAVVGNQPRYAYVSLFGLTSLAEVRKRVAEEAVAAIKLSGRDGTVGEVIEEGSWRLNPLQIMKILPAIPYLGKLEGLANELSFSSVRNIVICFDDLERGGVGLRLADVFGLASFLKEERNCRIVLISNEKKLNLEAQDDLLRYLEKVVDETVNFAPNSSEACKIALGESPDIARSLLRDSICRLEISNIRVISRLSNMAAELAVILKGLHARALQDSIHTLALFGAAYFLPTDGFPPVSYLMKLGEDQWAGYFRAAKKAGEETEKDHQLAEWDAQLTRYGYANTTPFDVEIGLSLQRGYFNRSILLPLAQQLSDNSEEQAVRTKYRDAWSKFWHSLNGNSEQMLRDLREISIEAINTIGADDLQHAFEVFSQAGQEDVARELLELFIASNQHRPDVFAQVDGVFSGRYSGEVAHQLRAAYEKHKARPSIEEALDRINFEEGWNSDDVRIVGKANIGEIERLLCNSEGRIFRARLKTLLRIGTLQDAQEDEKRVSIQTLEFLKRLASKDPIIAIRMRQYIPADQVGEKH